MAVYRIGHGPVDVMRRYLPAVQRGDWATGFGFFTDDVTLHVPGRSSLAGEHRGREAVEGYRFPSQCAALQGGGEGTPRRQAWC